MPVALLRPAAAVAPTADADPAEEPMTPELRTWTDVSGKHRIEATLLKVDGPTVHLRRADGRELAMPLAKLSTADQTYARQHAP